MKKYPIGFNTRINKEPEESVPMEVCKGVIEPKKSIVQVYFPHRGMGWAYYNDSFDLKVGDFVYVEGKLEGYRGQVTEVNYSFKIKLSDYKKVVAVIDTNVKGDFFMAGTHIVSFDRNAIPFSKVLTWFKAPENDEEYVSGNDDTNRFPLDDLSKMKISHDVADRGHDYYIENRALVKVIFCVFQYESFTKLYNSKIHQGTTGAVLNIFRHKKPIYCPKIHLIE